MTSPAHEVAARPDEGVIERVARLAKDLEIAATPAGERRPFLIAGGEASLLSRDIRTILTAWREAERERDEALEDIGRVILACPMQSGMRTSPAHEGVRALRSAFEASESTVAHLTRELEQAREDGARLEWLMARGARVVWHGKDSEFCSVWLPGTWDGDPERQVTELHVEARPAIDAARKALEPAHD